MKIKDITKIIVYGLLAGIIYISAMAFAEAYPFKDMKFISEANLSQVVPGVINDIIIQNYDPLSDAIAAPFAIEYGGLAHYNSQLAIGWGHIDSDGEEYAYFLMLHKIPVLNTYVCRKPHSIIRKTDNHLYDEQLAFWGQPYYFFGRTKLAIDVDRNSVIVRGSIEPNSLKIICFLLIFTGTSCGQYIKKRHEMK